MNITGATDILACATCMADRGGVTQQATNLGIFMMLAVMGLVFGGIASAFISLARKRARLLRGESPATPHS